MGLTLKQFTTNLSDKERIAWESENQVLIRRGQLGPFGAWTWVKSGEIDIKNPKDSGMAFKFTLISRDVFGSWKTQDEMTMTPNTHMHLGPYYDNDRVVLNWNTEEYAPEEHNPENNGIESTPFDGFVLWIQQNIWLVVGLILLFIFVLWLTFAGGAASLIGAAR